MEKGGGPIRIAK